MGGLDRNSWSCDREEEDALGVVAIEVKEGVEVGEVVEGREIYLVGKRIARWVMG